jgi:hypothetical protein
MNLLDYILLLLIVNTSTLVIGLKITSLVITFQKEKSRDSKPPKDSTVKSDAFIINDKKLNRLSNSQKKKKRN